MPASHYNYYTLLIFRIAGPKGGVKFFTIQGTSGEEKKEKKKVLIKRVKINKKKNKKIRGVD
jgi:hypothetical protein